MSAKNDYSSILSAERIYSSSDLEALGLSRMTIKRMLDSRELIQYTRGIYILPEAAFENGLSYAVMSKLKDGVVCLLSAAVYHEMGDSNPSALWFAVDRKKVKNANVASFRSDHTLIFWQPEMLVPGVEKHTIMGQEVRITNRARTVIDLFCSNKISEEAKLRAFSDFLKTDGNMDEVWALADELKVGEALKPYLQLAEELQESLPQRGI
jgi:predicted transcriptional regulator of viral defense system